MVSSHHKIHASWQDGLFRLPEFVDYPGKLRWYACSQYCFLLFIRLKSWRLFPHNLKTGRNEVLLTVTPV